MSLSYQAALERAQEAHESRSQAPPTGGPFSLSVAIGDPQASVETFLSILDRHGLLAASGWLRPSVRLVSIGDHFDFGGAARRKEAAQSGLRLTHWLAAHDPAQVQMLAGNHDLARLGELWGLDDPTHDEAVAAALEVYQDGETDPEREPEFLARFPRYPSAQVAARDLAGYCEEQAEWVLELFLKGRIQVAQAEGPRLLLQHAGVPFDHLHALGLGPDCAWDAARIAATLNQALRDALASWDRASPLSIPHLHRPGSAAGGEGGGLFYHRPAYVPEAQKPWAELGPEDAPVLSRRFDARRLPRGLTQVVGHVRDYRCLDILAPYAEHLEAQDGALRWLWTDGEDVAYRLGVPKSIATDAAQMIFLDAGMAYGGAETYPLLDLDRLVRAPEASRA